MPLFSIIIATYNRFSVLSQAINSVLLQTFKDWELIIIDDGSTDDTVLLLKEFSIDSRIKFYSQLNLGVSAARNAGSNIAEGEWLLFLDSDDVLLPNALTIFFLAIEGNKEIDIFCSGYIRKSLDGLEKLILPEDGDGGRRLSGNFVLRKLVFNFIGGYDPILRFGENTELFYRINIAGYKCYLIQNPTFVYCHNLNGGSKDLNNSTQSIIYFLEKHNNTLTPHIKFLYHQILGVNCLRSRNFYQSRRYFFKAYLIKPHKVSTLGRLLISLFPILAKKLYSEKVVENPN